MTVASDGPHIGRLCRGKWNAEREARAKHPTVHFWRPTPRQALYIDEHGRGRAARVWVCDKCRCEKLTDRVTGHSVSEWKELDEAPDVMAGRRGF